MIIDRALASTLPTIGSQLTTALPLMTKLTLKRRVQFKFSISFCNIERLLLNSLNCMFDYAIDFRFIDL